jgi:benzoate-CoA ligase family protein
MADIFNAASYLVSRHVAAGRAGAIAVRGSQTLTYGELDQRIADMTAAYRCLGLRRDDRVMIVMSDDVAMLTAILGAFRAGLVAVPVSTMFNGSELGGILADSGARVLLCSAEYAATAAAALPAAPGVEHVVRHGGAELPGAELSGGDLSGAELPVPPAVRRWSWAELESAAAAAPEAARAAVPTSGDSWALWLYTSGTTGSPKAAMHRHANIRHVCETYGTRVLGIVPADSTLSVAKMFFAYGIGNSVFFPLSVGGCTVLEPRRPAPEVIRERLARDRPTLFFGVPTFYAALVASDIPDDSFSCVRLAASAGEALPAPLQERFTRRFGVPVIDGIGSTEALHIFLSNQPGDIRPGTTGVPVPGYDVEVRTAGGELAAAGEPGALYVRGESTALGYWRRTDASRQVFQGEWLSTGDTYVRDAAGYFTCLGRNSDMMKAGGIWVSPAEVESRLLAHPLVRQAAVVAVPDADGLDKPVGVVVAAAGATQDAADEASLVAWCREGLAHFKAPRRIVFVTDLPTTATGKLQRFKVREQLAGAAPGAPA